MARRGVCLAPACLLWLVAGTASAQSVDTPIATDRPDFTDSADLVGVRTLQVELGIAVDREDAGDTRSFALTTPQALIRLGLHRRVELRMSADGFVLERSDVEHDRTTIAEGSDVDIGAKIRLADQADLGVDFALIPSLSAPIGGVDVSSGGWDPAIKFAWQRALPSAFDLSGNVNVGSVSDVRRRFTQSAVSASLSRDFGAGFSAFWEVYVLSAVVRDGSAAWTADTGVLWALGKNAQIDFTYGRGLSAPASDWFLSTGFSFRRPGRPRR